MPVGLYSDFQFIAYRFPSDKASNAEEPVDTGLISQQQLQTLKNAVPDDLAARFTRFLAALELAMNSEDVDPTASTLKIFVAPEFYFRPYDNANSRSYSEAAKTSFLAFLETFFSAQRYQNWLIILGTIVWNSNNKALLRKALSGSVAQNQLDALAQGLVDGITVWNTAIVVARNETVQIFQKTNYSEGDGIEKIYWPKASENASFKNADRQTIKVPMSKFFDQLVENNKPDCVIDVPGAGLFGIEICMDHTVSFLQKKGYPAYLAKHSPDHRRPLLFHVLTSCGMKLMDDRIALGQEGRFALSVDGSGIQVKGDFSPQSQIKSVMEVVNNGTAVVTCDRDNGDYKQVWAGLNQLKTPLITVPADLQLAAPSRQNEIQGQEEGYVRPQALAIYTVLPFSAEEQEEQQQQVNNADNANNNQVPQQVQGGNNQ